MLKVLTAAEMREVDRLTTERYGIPSILLMENAAHALARVIAEKLGGSVKDKSILILCGKGNNGGDGAALARILWTERAYVTVAIIGKVDQASGDALTNFQILRKLNEREAVVATPENFRFLEHGDVYTRECPDAAAWKEFLSEPFNEEDPDILVDALFGTGLTRPLTNLFEDVAGFIRGFKIEGVEQKTLVVSVDLPSGLNADLSEKIGVNPLAHLTVTFTAPKIANVIPPASSFNGEVFVVDIGSPKELIEEQPSKVFQSEKQNATRWLEKTRFSDSSYKNKRGHCVLIAGSESYSGAAVMCGNAAMRSGVGLVTLAVPESCKTEVASRSLPEVIVTPIREKEGNVSDEAFADNAEILEKADAIAVGCGLSETDKGVEKLVREIVETRKTPVIVDAGALWFFSPVGTRLQKPAREQGRYQDVDSYALPHGRASATAPPLILTPHEGEFMRLLGTDDKEAIKDRVAAVREFSQKHNVILVLKGERVLIGEPGGKVVVNPTGNSGLGKAGNGDTLTGIITGFVTQAATIKIDIFEAVVAAVYIAGLAGDIAEKKFGKRVMTASDVRECLADAFREVQSRE